MKPNPTTTDPRLDPAPKHAFFEPLALLLLSLATVGTAWCSYQAASWAGSSIRLMNQSSLSGRSAAANQLQSSQLAILDVLLFSQYINSRAASNEPLTRFYEKRFRPEAKQAFDAWMATKPFDNPDAPAHPFLTNFYQPKLLADAARFEAESQRLWIDAGDAGRNGRAFVLTTVLLSTALFCAGTASKFDHPWIRRAVLGLGLASFAFAATRLFLIPMHP